jgi:hypothetical protein
MHIRNGRNVGNVFFRNLKEAKRNLRRVQKQTAAEERNKLYHENYGFI